MDIKGFITHRFFDENLLLKRDETFPKISIITPSYNQAQFLERTIISVLNQNYPNMEFIVIDGGSTDNSIEIIKKYEEYLTYWVSEPDNGQSDAINKGFRVAKGDILAWQNSDDIYLPGAFNKVGEIYNKNTKTDLVFGNIYLIDSNDKINNEMRFVPFSLNDLLYFDWNIGSQAAFWSRRIMEKVGLLRDDISTCFDFDWFIRLGRNTKEIQFTKDFLGAYRIHEDAKLSTVSQEKRWPVLVDIYKKNGLNIIEKVPFNEQFRLHRFLMLFRRLFYYTIQCDFDYIFRKTRKVVKRRNIYLDNEERYHESGNV